MFFKTNNSEGNAMEVLKKADFAPVPAIILDVDNTLYNCPRYSGEGRGNELAAIAQKLGVTVDRANERIEELRAQITLKHGGRRATLTEAIAELFPLPWWNEVRQSCYRPEKWLKPDPVATKVVRTIRAEFSLLVAASNAPRNVMHRVLGTMALRRFFYATWAPEDGGAKHDPEYWRRLTDRLGVPACQCISIGDRREADCDPAITAGFGGAILVAGASDLPEVVRYLIEQKTAGERG